MSKISKEEVKNRCNKFKERIKKQNSFQELYKKPNIKGISTYLDFSRILLEIDVNTYLNEIKPNTIRKESYKVPSHNGITEKGDLFGKKFKWEDREVIWFFNYYSLHKDKHFRIIDYQIPMKDTNNDKEKAIDALATDGKDLYILEYKGFSSNESLLRSVLEIYSYLRLINEGLEKFKCDFGLPNAKVFPGILLMKGSTQYIEFVNQKADSNSPIIQLINILGIEVLIISTSEQFIEDRETTGKDLALTRPFVEMDLIMNKFGALI